MSDKLHVPLTLMLYLCNTLIVVCQRKTTYRILRLQAFYRLTAFPVSKRKKKNRERKGDNSINLLRVGLHTFGLTEKILFLYAPPYKFAPRFALSPESLKFENTWSALSDISVIMLLTLNRSRSLTREASVILRWRCKLSTAGWWKYFHVTISLFELISKKCRLVGRMN